MCLLFQVCWAAVRGRCRGQREDEGVQAHTSAHSFSPRPGGTCGALPQPRSRRVGHKPRGGDPSECRVLRRREALRVRPLSTRGSKAAGRRSRPQNCRQEAAHAPAQRLWKLQPPDCGPPPAAWSQARCCQLCRIHTNGLSVTGSS